MCLKDCECFNICLFSYSKEGLRLKMDTQEGCTDDKIIHNLQKKTQKIRRLTLEDVPLNAPSTSQQSSHSTVPSHHLPKNYVSNDSSLSFDETPRCETSVEAASLAEQLCQKKSKGAPLQKSLKHSQVLSRFLVHLLSVEGGWHGGNCGELVDCYTKLMRQ